MVYNNVIFWDFHNVCVSVWGWGCVWGGVQFQPRIIKFWMREEWWDLDDIIASLYFFKVPFDSSIVLTFITVIHLTYWFETSHTTKTKVIFMIIWKRNIVCVVLPWLRYRESATPFFFSETPIVVYHCHIYNCWYRRVHQYHTFATRFEAKPGQQ